MADLQNTFTWSVSRDKTFETCARQYWWNYYGSWGGWSRDADPEARRAYMLKNLSNRWAWVGTAVHEAIEGLLKRLQRRGGHGTLDFEGRADEVRRERELERLTERMRRDYVSSRDGRYRDQPKKAFGLVEHEYDEPVSRDEWAAMNDKARAALDAFLGSPLFDEIRSSDPARWLPIEQLDQFDMEGTPVWVVLDFARRMADDTLHIYDWKTGKVDPEANRPQLGCYTLYVGLRHGTPPAQVVNHLVYLGTDLTEVTFTLEEADLLATKDFLRQSIARMKARLVDPAANAARREDFPLTDDLERCAACSFRRLCGRE
ncbi:MAG: PD-(D/E)XK nuclease family protein [Planctomycetota bacterium]